MGLRDIFGSDVARYERERERERKFQNTLDDSMKRFRRQGRQLLAEGDMTGLRALYIERAIEPAMKTDGEEVLVLERIEEELYELMAEYENEDELEEDPFVDI